MKTYVQNGDVVDYTAGSDISSGDVVVIGGRVGVAVNDIANGKTGAVRVKGVVTLPKASAAVIGDGEGVIWDGSAGNCDDDQATPASGDLSFAGVAVGAAGNGAVLVNVDLGVQPATVA